MPYLLVTCCSAFAEDRDRDSVAAISHCSTHAACPCRSVSREIHRLFTTFFYSVWCYFTLQLSRIRSGLVTLYQIRCSDLVDVCIGLFTGPWEMYALVRKELGKEGRAIAQAVSPASHRGGSGSSPGLVMWDFVMDRSFPCQTTFHLLLHNHLHYHLRLAQ
jgi:hypothetical protein